MRTVAGLAFLLSGAASSKAQLTITAEFDSSITSLSNAAAVETAIDAAISQTESLITTPYVDNVKIDFQSNIATPLAENISALGNISYTQYLSDLQANPLKSATQIQAISTMPSTGNAFSAAFNGDTTMTLTAANLAAIGETQLANQVVQGNGGINGTVYLNTSIMNASRTGLTSQDDGNYDLQSAAQHEMDEVLGIGGYASTLDGGSGIPDTVGSLDLFRYTSTTINNVTTYQRSFTNSTSNSNVYFSIDGGKTNLVYFNQNKNGQGDFADWGNGSGENEVNTPPQVQDAFGGAYEAPSTSDPTGSPPPPNLGANELTAFQVIGYNLVHAVAFWKGGTDGTWTGSNWTSDVGGTLSTSAPNAQTDVAFSANGAANEGNTTLGQNFTIHSLTINDTKAVTINSGGAFTLTISGAAGTGITVNSGAGKFTLNANLTFAGSSNTITVNNFAGAVINGVIGGNNGLIKAGTGTLTLEQANDYKGSTTVAQGTLFTTVSGALPSTTNLVMGTAGSVIAGVLNLDGTSQTINGLSLASGNTGATSNVITTTGGASTLTVSSTTTNSSYGGSITGAISLVKAGAGTTLTLNGFNTYSGTTTITGGTVLVGTSTTAGALGTGAVSVNSGSGLTLVNITSNTFANSVSNGVSGVGTLTISSAATNTLSGVLSDGAAGQLALTQSGTGTTILSNTNTYSGTTSVNAGTLQVNGSLAAGSTVNIATAGTLSGTGEINGDVTMTGAGTINLGSGAVIGGGLTITGGKWNGFGTVDGAVTSSSGTFTLNGNLTTNTQLSVTGGTLAGTGTLTGLLVYSSSSSATFGGVITGNNGGVTLNSGTGTLTLTGANSPSGTSTVNSGTLQIGNGTSGNFGNGSVMVNGSGILVTDLATNATFAPSVDLTSATATLKATQAGTNTLSGVISGSGILDQNGSGTTILTGANTFNGATNVNAGTLQIGNGTSGNLGGGNVTVLGSSALAIDMADGTTLSSNVSLGTSTTLKAIESSGTTTLSGVISGSGTFNQTGAGTTIIANGTTDTYTGATNISAGTLDVEGSLGAGSTVNIATAGTLSGGGTVNGKATLTGNGTINLSGGSIDGTLAITGGNWTGTGTVNSLVTSSGGVFNLTGGLTAAAGVNVTGGMLTGNGTLTGSLNYTSSASSTFAGVIAGGATGSSLTLNNASATLTLTGTSTYAGPTTITAGTLQIGDSNSGNLMGTSGITISGTGKLVLDLAGTASFSPNINLNATGTSVKALESGTTTISGVISGAGSLNQNGTGTTVIPNGTVDSYTGATNVNAGTLEVDGSLAAGSAVNVATTGMLTGTGTINGKATLTGIGTIGLNGGTIGGTLAITGGNWTGTGTVDGAVTSTTGAFNLTGTLTAPVGLSVTGGMLTGNGALNGNLSYTSSTSSLFAGAIGDGAKSSSLTLNNASATLTLTGTSNYSGATTISAGTLQIGNGSSGNLSGTSGVSVLGSGVLSINLADKTSFTPNINLGAAGATLKMIGSNTNTLSGVISGSGIFDQNGGGTTIIPNGTADTYTGPTNINGGTLEVDGSLAAGSTVAVTTAGTLTGGGTINGKATLTGNGTINLSSGTIGGTLAVTGGNWSGTGTVDGVVTSSSGSFNLGGTLI
ncbi:MAG TPA: NF038122 family metalloprotease, partial [Chthoniobacter sp.]